jgi:isopentenyl diphosphate isomerase/L-lactate dehydrogenase-like FMN-dependent dehydrogenase
VLIGRSTLYGTAAAGEAGATRALDLYRGEISRTMAQISCNRVSEIGPEHVAVPAPRHVPLERPGQADYGTAANVRRLAS